MMLRIAFCAKSMQLLYCFTRLDEPQNISWFISCIVSVVFSKCLLSRCDAGAFCQGSVNAAGEQEVAMHGTGAARKSKRILSGSSKPTLGTHTFAVRRPAYLSRSLIGLLFYVLPPSRDRPIAIRVQRRGSRYWCSIGADQKPLMRTAVNRFYSPFMAEFLPLVFLSYTNPLVPRPMQMIYKLSRWTCTSLSHIQVWTHIHTGAYT